MILAALLLLGGLWWSGWLAAAKDRADALPARRALASRLTLTDLAIWTEARYTRHPSQADFFSPFQDGPSSLDHFPAGAILGPAARAARHRTGAEP